MTDVGATKCVLLERLDRVIEAVQTKVYSRLLVRQRLIAALNSANCLLVPKGSQST